MSKGNYYSGSPGASLGGLSDGCLDSFIILIVAGGLMVYGGIKGVKALCRNTNKNQQKIEQAIQETKTPTKVIAWNNIVKSR